MQAAVYAEMQVAENAATTVEVIGRRSEDNRMKMGTEDWLELYFTKQVRHSNGGGNKIQNWDVFVWAFLSCEFFLAGHHRYRRWNGAYIICKSEKSGPSKQV